MSIYSAAVLAANPVLYWQLNESAGSSQVTDYGSFGLNGTVGSGFTLGSTPILGSDSRTSLSMPGNPNNLYKLVQSVFDSRLELTQYVTLEFVYKPNGFPPNGGSNIVSIGSNQSTNGPAIDQLPNGQIQFYVDYTSAYITSNTNLISGQAYHIAGTFDGSTIKIYIDGVLDNSTAYSGPIGGYDGIHGFAIGNGNTVGSPNSAPGSIQDTAVYNYALLGATIANHSKIALGYVNSSYEQLVQASNPVLYWPLGDPIGYAQAIDYGPNKLNGVVGSAISFSETNFIPNDQTTSVLFPGGTNSTNHNITAPLNSVYQLSTAFTFEMIIQVKSFQNSPLLVCSIDGNSNKLNGAFGIIGLYSNTQQLRIIFNNADIEIDTPALIVGQVYHVAVTYSQSAGIIILYLNGISVGTQNYSKNILYDNNSGFILGDWNTARTVSMNAEIQNVAIYNTALSATTVLEHAGILIPNINTVYEQAVITANPILYWPLNEGVGSSTVIDYSQNELNGNVGSSLVLGSTPILGSDPRTSVYMPGGSYSASKEITSAQSSLIQPTSKLSAEFIYKPTSNPTQAVALVSLGLQAGSNSGGLYIAINTSGQIYSGINAGNAVTTTSPLVLNQTYHVALTYDGSNVIIYLDGVQNAITAYSTSTIGGYNGIQGLVIGDNYPARASSPNGYIKDVALYNYALSSTTVAAHSKIALGYVNSLYEQAVQAANPALYWPLGDPIGYPIAIDYGPNNLNGTLGSAVSFTETTLVANDQTTSALLPAGASTNDIISSANSSAIQPTSQITIEFILKLNNNVSDAFLISLGYYYGAGSNGPRIFIQNNQVIFSVNNNGSDGVASNSTLVTNEVYHIVCTYNGVAKNIYINGVLDISSTGTYAMNGYVGVGLYLGNFYQPFTGAVNINISDVAIYDTALSATTIVNHANLVTTVPVSSIVVPVYNQYEKYVLGFNPLAFYPLNETSGTIAYDISGNNYNANVINTVTQGVTGTAFGTSLQSAEFYSAYEFNSTPLTGFVDIGNQIPYTGSSSNRQNYPGSGNELGVYFFSGWITFWMRAIAPNTGGGMLVYINNVGLTVDNFGNLGFYQENSSNYPGAVNFNIVGSNVMDGQDHFIAFSYTKGYYQASGNGAGFNSANVTYVLTIYVDANQIYSGQPFSYHTSNPSQDSAMVQTDSSIGAFHDGTQLFNGCIKLVTLFDYASEFNLITMFELGYAYITYTNQLDYIPQLLDYNISSILAGKLIDAPASGISNFQIVPLGLEESLRLDYLNRLQQTGICPNPNSPIIIPIGYVYGSTSAFAPGNYYRVPVDTTMVVDNQIIPKYFNNFTYPISTFVYPSTSEYNGLILVKSSSYTGSLPNDVIQLSGTQVIADLITYVNEIFVF